MLDETWLFQAFVYTSDIDTLTKMILKFYVNFEPPTFPSCPLKVNPKDVLLPRILLSNLFSRNK